MRHAHITGSAGLLDFIRRNFFCKKVGASLGWMDYHDVRLKQRRQTPRLRPPQLETRFLRPR